MKPARLRSLAAGLLVLIAPASPRALAHGAGHEAILALTADLAKRPGDPELLLQRGERHRIHGDLAAARADLSAALSNNPALHPARLRLALVDRDEGRLADALQRLDIVVAAETTNLLARTARAEVLSRAGRHADALPDLERVVAESRAVRPDLHLSLARTRLAANTNDWRSALADVELGLQRLGPIPSLQNFALELEEGGRDFDAAIRRIDGILDAANRKERWFLRRGDLHRRAGRDKEARADYRRALEALDALPERLRRTIASEELRREAEGRLAVDAPAAGSSPAK